MSNSPAVVDESKPLSAGERQRLNALTEVVIANFKAFVIVGQALAEIRDRQLYREEFRTFELYCKQVFDIAKGTAYRYIAAAEVVENVSNWRQNDGDVIDLLPVNEAQVRPLTKLQPAQQVQVWQFAVKTAKGGHVTASHVDRAVKKFLGDTTKHRIRKEQEKVAGSRQVSAEFKAAFDALLAEIERAREEGYKSTSREQVLDHLDSLRRIVAEDGRRLEDVDVSVSDASKLQQAGFTLFRIDEHELRIKERDNDNGAWKKHSGPYETKAALHRAFAQLMLSATNIRG
ncbi:MAG: hypothetical protein OEV91_01355 [Desulfobulbaceae bacterium]|nr:hypothetical protein [Desulfobulbaceae bacterium]